MKVISFFSLIFIIIGALNWGLWGFFQFDLVSYLLDASFPWAARIVYCIIGLAGVWSISFLGKCRAICSCCNKKDDMDSKE